MKFKDVFKINYSKCEGEDKDCFQCQNMEICLKLNEYKNEQDECNPF